MRYVDNYYGYVQIFTDGSKKPDTGRVSVAYVIPEFNIKLSARVTDHLSVFSRAYSNNNGLTVGGANQPTKN